MPGDRAEMALRERTPLRCGGPFATAGEIWSTAAIGLDGTVYVGSLDRRIYAIGSNGVFKWAYQAFGPIGSSPAVTGNGMVYASSVDKNLYALRLKWAVELGNCSFSSPLLAQDGTIYVGSNDRKLHTVGYDGKLRFSADIGGGFSSSPARAADGTLYVGSDDHSVGRSGDGERRLSAGQRVGALSTALGVLVYRTMMNMPPSASISQTPTMEHHAHFVRADGRASTPLASLSERKATSYERCGNIPSLQEAAVRGSASRLAFFASMPRVAFFPT